MIKSRITKIEKSIPVNNRPYKNLSSVQLAELARKLRISIYKKIKNPNVANEYKTLFIDNPTSFEMMRQTDKTPKEMLVLLEKQRDCDVKYETSETRKDRVLEQYEKIIKSYKFFKGL
jgi:hypothetical protein